MQREGELGARLAKGDRFLTEAAVVERMRREFEIPADEQLVYGGAIYDRHARATLGRIYDGYLDIARRASMPILLTTSTRRCNRDRIRASRHAQRNVNRDWLEFLREVRGDRTDPIFLGSLLGARGDAYRPSEALGEKEAYAFHRAQCDACADGDADFLMAGVLPALSEAKGLARAMAETGRPFLVSFIIDRTGRLLDGTPLRVAIASVDEVAPPLCYMVNCVHPDSVRAGLEADAHGAPSPSRPRLVGIQANASRLNPAQLDGRADLDGDDAATIAGSMVALQRDHAFQIFGGCCGTDGTHLEEIARRLSTVVA